MRVGMGNVAAREEEGYARYREKPAKNGREPLTNGHHFAHNSVRHVVVVGEVLAGHDLCMTGPDRVDIQKCDHEIRLVNELTRHHTLSDTTEEAIRIAHFVWSDCERRTSAIL